MKTILICLTALCGIIACDKEDDDMMSSSEFDGAYAGIFKRTGGDSADIRLDMFNGKFSGYSMQYRYPAICGGSFNKSANSIAFNDTCGWTPGYEPALRGSFSIEPTSDGRWRIWKTEGNITDEYLIRRMTR